MKVLTYNVWHGLDSRGLWKFPSLESAGRKEERFHHQIQAIKKLDPDIIFLQEVHPAERQAHEYANSLKMDCVLHRDQGGLKFAGLGIPINLMSALVILAKPEFKLKSAGSRRLSGHPFGFCTRWFSFQLAEFRYLVSGSIEHKGQKILLVNSHLHHGRGVEDKVSQTLDRLQKDAKITEDQRLQILAAMDRAQARRRCEIENILKWVQMNEKKFDSIILGGDLNVAAGAPEVGLIEAAGFVDAHKAANSSDPGYTWDSTRNVVNHEFAQKLFHPIPTFGVAELRQLYRDMDIRKERIDFVFTKGALVPRSCQIVLDSGDPIGSDHFGVLAELNK